LATSSWSHGFAAATQTGGAYESRDEQL
jgi:hypothetical protein